MNTDDALNILNALAASLTTQLAAVNLALDLLNGVSNTQLTALADAQATIATLQATAVQAEPLGEQLTPPSV